MKWLYAFLIANISNTCAKAENDTATSTNILPNAGTTSSSMDNFNLDGVNSGTGASIKQFYTQRFYNYLSTQC